jgi:hypothetical protein
MKRILIVSIVLLLLAWCSVARAVECTQSLVGIRDHQTQIVGKYALTFVCTASSSDATYTPTPISAANLARLATFFLYRAETAPGSTPPQDQYDITVVNANGVDVVGALLMNRSRTSVQDVLLAPASGYYQIGSSGLTVTPTGNNVNSAAFTLTLEFTK